MLSPRAKVALRPKFWPRPWPQRFGLGLASISLPYYVIGHFSGKIRVNFRNFVNFSGNNLKSYVVNHYFVLSHNYIWPQPWPQPAEIGLGLGLVLVALASASRFWPRLSSLEDSDCHTAGMSVELSNVEHHTQHRCCGGNVTHSPAWQAHSFNLLTRACRSF